MNLPFFIAKRYLVSKKNHSVINILSIVSACAIGIGALALIVILSVFNGFGKLAEQISDSSAPDFVVEPIKGKIIDLNDTLLIKLKEDLPNIICSPVVEENAYIQYGNYQCVGKIKGVNYLQKEDSLFSNAIVGKSIAQQLGVIPNSGKEIDLYVPSRLEDISIVMPMESINSAKVYADSIINTPQSPDNEKVFVPLLIAQEINEYEENQVNRIEIYLDDSDNRYKIDETSKSEKIRIEKQLRKALEQNYIVKNKRQQNETIYKMVKSEKLAVYIILFFVIIVIAINILATVAMMIIDKKKDIQTYNIIGMKKGAVRKSFILHGSMVCACGVVVGVALGVIICLIQQHYGIIPLPGNYLTESYPIDIHLSDIIVSTIGIIAIGFIMSLIPSRLIK